MSVSRHSAELGFTLIKEGLPKSAGSSLAPLQPRAERASGVHSLPAIPFAPSFLPLVSMPLTFVPFKKEKKKKKKTLSSAFPPVGLCSTSLHSPSKYRRREREEEEGKKNAPKHR